MEISDLENLDNFLEKQTPYMSTNQIRVLLNNGFDIEFIRNLTHSVIS